MWGVSGYTHCNLFIHIHIYSLSWATLLISNKWRQISLSKSSSYLVKCGMTGSYCNLQVLSLQRQNHTLVATGFFIKDTAIVTPLSSTHLVCSWVIYWQCQALWSLLSPGTHTWVHAHTHTEYPDAHMPSFSTHKNRICIYLLKDESLYIWIWIFFFKCVSCSRQIDIFNMFHGHGFYLCKSGVRWLTCSLREFDTAYQLQDATIQTYRCNSVVLVRSESWQFYIHLRNSTTIAAKSFRKVWRYTQCTKCASYIVIASFAKSIPQLHNPYLNAFKGLKKHTQK